MKEIPFIDDSITISVHSATNSKHLRDMTIAEFADGEPVAVFELDNRDLLIKRGRQSHYPRAFIQGEIITNQHEQENT